MEGEDTFGKVLMEEGVDETVGFEGGGRMNEMQWIEWMFMIRIQEVGMSCCYTRST